MRSVLIITVIFISMIAFIPATAQDISRSKEPLKFEAYINVSATVVESIQMITVNSMNLGNAPPGETIIRVNPINSMNAGFMIAVGTPTSEFRLNYSPVVELTQIDGDGKLIFNYDISGNNSENQSSSELFESENQIMQFNNDGRYYIWLGGRLNIENAVPGNYEGDFTIEIEYI